MVNESYERILLQFDQILGRIIVQDSANTRVGGVSFTALQKQFLSTLALKHDSEQMVLRKILQGILNEELVSYAALAQTAIPVVVSNEKYHELEKQFKQLESDYQEVFSKVGSDNFIALTKEEYLALTQPKENTYLVTDEHIRKIIDIVTDNDDNDEALEEIRDYLNNGESDED